MSAAFNNSVSVSTEVMSSTFPVLLPGIGYRGCKLGCYRFLETNPENKYPGSITAPHNWLIARVGEPRTHFKTGFCCVFARSLR